MRYAASLPRNASVSAAASPTSASITCAPRFCNAANLSADRATAFTFTPAASRRVATVPPVFPVAPSTVTVMAMPPLVGGFDAVGTIGLRRRRHICDREADASGAAARFDEDAGLQHVPQRQARGAPRLDVMGDGDRPGR